MTNRRRTDPARLDLSAPAVVVDDEFVVLSVSPLVEDVLGVATAEVVGTPFGRWIAPSDLELAPRVMADLGGAYEMRLVTGAGAVVVVEMRVRRLDAHGDQWGIWVDRVVEGTIDLTGDVGEAVGEVDAPESPASSELRRPATGGQS